MTVRKQNDHRYEFAPACSRHATGHTHTNSGGVVNELMIALIDRRRSALTPDVLLPSTQLTWHAHRVNCWSVDMLVATPSLCHGPLPFRAGEGNSIMCRSIKD